MFMVTDHGILHGYYLINEKQSTAPNVMKTIKQLNPVDTQVNLTDEEIEMRLKTITSGTGC